MVYQFKSCSYISADPQVAGEQCEQLASEGRLTAKALVDINRLENAPLHGAFEWRDEVAAERYREDQARHIIRSLLIVQEGREPVRALYNIVRNDPEYKHIDTILQSADDTQRLLETALREFAAFRKKYQQLQQLSGLFEAFDQMNFTCE